MRSHITQIRTLAASLVLAAALACAHGGMSVGLTYTDRQPPPDRVEVIGVAPGAGYVWVGGHWSWQGNDFGWTPGHWVAVERGYRHWVPGHWQQRRHRWYWVEGHWGR